MIKTSKNPCPLRDYILVEKNRPWTEQISRMYSMPNDDAGENKAGKENRLCRKGVFKDSGQGRLC